MILRSVAGCLMLLTNLAVRAAQPSAPAPPEAPIRKLPWGQLNFLHSTDTHGWHAGHLQEPSYSADWGDYISFAQRLGEMSDEMGTDLLLVDTGDRIEGNGLYDSSDPKGVYTREIFKHQHIDIITVGNHELYKSNSSENEYYEMVPNFKGNYLASNLDFIKPDGQAVPLAPRFKKFTTKNRGIRIIAFGFLFDFTGNSNNTVVQKVEDTVNEQWFQDAIHDRDVDLFVIAGHVAIRSPEYSLLYETIRKVQWDTRIQFFGGHTHIRDFKKYDSKAYALESGRYMETIGFQSIIGLPDRESRERSRPPPGFSSEPIYRRRYIDNNLFSFHQHTGLNESSFPTELGRNVSAQIHSARKALDLDSTFGCAPRDLWTNRAPFGSYDSIFTWLEKQVVPDMVVEPERSSKPRIVIQNTGAIRFDIFKGPFTKDTTYIVSPFTSGFRYIKDVPFALADRVLLLLNQGGPIFSDSALSDISMLAAPLPQQRPTSFTPPVYEDPATQAHMDLCEAYEFYHAKQPPQPIQQPIQPSSPPPSPPCPLPLQNVNTLKNPHNLPLTPGYTTTDDAGDDGDDTIHSPIEFFLVPNCFETRVNLPPSTNSTDDMVVDLVYGDFIEAYVLLALKFLGGEFDSKKDTEVYLPGKDFTGLIREWVGRNWDCESK